jgi:hypothetical protein
VVDQVQRPSEVERAWIDAVLDTPTVKERPYRILRNPADQESGFGELPFPISAINCFVMSTSIMASMGTIESSS